MRQMTPSEYNEILLPWFAGYDWEPVPRESLPKNCFISFKDGQPRVFTSYYTSDSNMVILGYTISNPYIKISETEVEEALKFLINHIKESGAKYIHYSTGKGGIGIVRKLKKLGMTVTCSHGYIMGMSVSNNSIKFLQED